MAMAVSTRTTQRARRQPRRRGRTQAQRADKYDLYQKAVQEPEADIPLIDRVFRRHRGRPPRTLREDFCGTAHMACCWVAGHPENRAFGIDLDPEPLAWGERHNLGPLTQDQRARVHLIEGDVRTVACGRVDVTVAFNFSYFLFKTRREMLHYFRRVLDSLAPDGMFVLDAYGGADAQRTSQEERRVDGFTYVWDQHSFDPIHNNGQNFIHFEFPDGSRLFRAFRYEWRIWSIPEIREMLAEAGFAHTEVYWEGTDSKTGEGNGVFTRREKAIDDPAWIAYLVALR